MCGIAGFFHYADLNKIADGALLRKMCDRIAHRGPDAEGMHTDGPVALGHRRLSIIDLSPTGAQPMFSPGERYAVVYNGEIYNYQELGKELEALGVKFRGRSDTEVLLRAFEAWGVASFARLNGIFALALWDKKEKALYLARDPVGIKPLFFSDNGRDLFFASEVKAILASSAVNRAHDDDALVDFFCQNYVAHPKTGWKAIRQLEPGAYLKVIGGKIEKILFTSFSEVPEKTDSKNWEDEFRQRWEAAVKRQTVADVPVGAFLSGGLDSTAMVKALKAQGKEDIKLFCVRFPDASYDESHTAQDTARAMGLPLELIDIPDDLRDLPQKISLHLEDPCADASSLAVYLMCREASRRVKVALSGDGGDELFAGYDTYQASLFSAKLHTHLFRPALSLGKVLAHLVQSEDHRYSKRMVIDRFLSGAGHRFPLNHASWRTINYPATRKMLFGPAIAARAQEERYLEQYAEAAKEFATSDRLTQLLNMDFKYYLPSNMLVKVDRMSMAHGLEVRVPFLDIDFVRFARKMPSNLKRAGKSKKEILKRYLKGTVPEQTLRLPKAGFNFPIERMMRGAWGDLLLDTAKGFRTEIEPYLKIEALEKLLADHRNQKMDYRFELFNALMFALWVKNSKTTWAA